MTPDLDQILRADIRLPLNDEQRQTLKQFFDNWVRGHFAGMTIAWPYGWRRRHFRTQPRNPRKTSPLIAGHCQTIYSRIVMLDWKPLWISHEFPSENPDVPGVYSVAVKIDVLCHSPFSRKLIAQGQQPPDKRRRVMVVIMVMERDDGVIGPGGTWRIPPEWVYVLEDSPPPQEKAHGT